MTISYLRLLSLFTVSMEPSYKPVFDNFLLPKSITQDFVPVGRYLVLCFVLGLLLIARFLNATALDAVELATLTVYYPCHGYMVFTEFILRHSSEFCGLMYTPRALEHMAMLPARLILFVTGFIRDLTYVVCTEYDALSVVVIDFIVDKANDIIPGLL